MNVSLPDLIFVFIFDFYGRELRDDKGRDTGRTETGRREVGDRSEEFYLNWHSRGMQNLEFEAYFGEKVIKYSILLISFYGPAKVQKRFRFVMKKMGEFLIV